MWIVRLALRRPYTIAVLCLGIVLFGGLAIARSKVDVLPSVDIPVVVVVWAYPGLIPEEMEKRVIFLTERALSTTISDIERLDSQSISGIGVVKIYFHPDVEIGGAIAQVTSVCNTILRLMPPGMTPPNVLQFNASNVPVAQLTLSGEGLGEQELFDYGLNVLRLRLFTIPGLATPAPYGGRQKQVMVDIDPGRLAATGLSPQDVVNALTAQNVILPAGSARLGSSELDVQLNNSPLQVAEFNQLPVREVNGRLVRMGDVANVHQGYAVQQNVVHVDGRRSTYLALLRKAGSSTLAVVDSVKDMLPALQRSAPQGLKLELDFDQSQFVRASVHEVLREALLAAALVSLMILFFLGSWRGMVIVCSSIPIAILVSIVGLFLGGQTMNLMTLGGLALAIGMLVDDATVEVENIHRNSAIPGEDGQPRHLTRVVLDSAHQIAVPALAATLTICIVFFPVVLLTGPARFLFRPLALAVVLAMLASYLLSRTLVPTLARMLMEREHAHIAGGRQVSEHAGPVARFAARFNARRDRLFDRFQAGYGAVLAVVLAHRVRVGVAALLLLLTGLSLARVVGLDFFPQVDTGQMRLHYRAPRGTRVELTERQVLEVERAVRELARGEVASVVDNIGIPISYNLAFVQTSNAGGEDAEIRISLRPGHEPSGRLMDRIRRELPARFPGAQLWFEPADVVSQVLSFGLPAQLEAEVVGRDPEAALRTAQEVAAAVRRVPGAVDVHLAQVFDRPALGVEVDRQQAEQLGLSERDVASSLLTSLSSSTLSAPSFWVDPRTGVNYTVAVQTPIDRIRDTGDLLGTPLSAGSGSGGSGSAGALGGSSGAGGGAPADATPPGGVTAPYLGAISALRARTSRTAIAHDTVQPVVEVQLAASDRDLGAVASEIQASVDRVKLPPGISVKLRGQSESMFQAFGRLGLGLVLAVALVYLLLAVLFQSWADPLIIVMAVPGALVGILWMLSLTGTTLNVESFMGAIMAVGIATSNSILLVSFANDYRAAAEKDPGPLEAVLEAGRTRLRPVLMTALAMILGMLPMAIGMGEGGEQNAPLGRAVIGGLLAATFSTLFLVPVAYTFLRRKAPRKHELDVTFAAEAGEAPPRSSVPGGTGPAPAPAGS
ncbi:efflux RND transporter permease subunit [Anaeromyxobacter paludicola]|uniref:RND transporter n=1 Tax=Anaeromyxobacter paludicola TaxID=2918171 RepID=A0ABM7X9K9_9BACT|nr:efflux RND transporter permease subunit [Anaeromyxobacter paludicola]BDG08500.1 RND transporter [Anaeromyxobacter paludicola]